MAESCTFSQAVSMTAQDESHPLILPGVPLPQLL
jgi:hypothetical protein